MWKQRDGLEWTPFKGQRKVPGSHPSLAQTLDQSERQSGSLGAVAHVAQRTAPKRRTIETTQSDM